MEMPHCRRRPRPARPPCPRCRQWRLKATRGLRRRSSSPCRSNTPRRSRRRRRPRIGPRRKPTHNRPRNPRPGRRSRPLRRPRPCTRLSPRRNRPPRRCRRLPGRPPRPWRACPMRRCRRTGVAAGDLARRHGRRPAECDQRLARRAGKPHGRPALGRPPGPGREPAGAALFRSLLDAGFSTKLVRTLVERMPEGLDADAALAWARNELVTHLPVLGSEDTFLSGGVYALVGPTGVGKTTTLAKLAARCVAREGRDQVAMLTTDNFRIGALEQLQIYGRLMGVPTHSVRDAGELRRLLAELGSRKIVLIDTTGISQRDRHVAEQAAMLCDAGKTVRRLLVLNAASQGDTLDEVAYAYRNGVGEDVAGCIITKLDEASRLGAALDTAIRHRLPIHYMSVGQKVPEHLELARPDALIDRAFAMVERAARSTPERGGPGVAVVLGQGNAGRRPGAASAVAGLGHPAAAGRGRGGGGGAESGRHAELAGQRSGLRPGARVLARVCQRRRGFQPVGPGRRAAGDGAARILRSLRAASAGDARQGRHEGRQPAGRHAAGFHADERSGRRAGCAGAAAGAGPRHAVLVRAGRGRAAGSAAALEARVRWLGGQLGQVPLVHMLEAGTSALWSALTEQGVSWVARSPGGLRVIQDECPTNLNAVGKSVGYLPVGQPGDMPGLRPVAGGARGAAGALGLGHRDRVAGPGRRICDATGVRALDRYGQRRGGGAVLRPDQSAGFAGRCRHGRAVAGAAGRGQGRFPLHGQCLAGLAGRRWRPCAGAPGLDGRPMAAACWQLAHSPAAEVVRGPCRAWRAWIASS